MFVRAKCGCAFLILAPEQVVKSDASGAVYDRIKLDHCGDRDHDDVHFHLTQRNVHGYHDTARACSPEEVAVLVSRVADAVAIGNTARDVYYAQQRLARAITERNTPPLPDPKPEEPAKADACECGGSGWRDDKENSQWVCLYCGKAKPY